MISFKSFLAEKEVKPYKFSEHELEETISILNKNCKQALATIDNPIWRGFKNHKKDYVVIDPATGERQSQNTANHYTVLLDSSPYYKDWPKRSKSLICTTAEERARHYSFGALTGGAAYAIFPFDNAKIAVCPYPDVWDTRIGYIHDFKQIGMEDAFADFGSLPDTLGGDFGLENPKSIKDLQLQCKRKKFIDNLAMLYPPSEKDRFGRAAKLAEKFIDILYEAMQPEYVGMQLMDVKQFAEFNKSETDREVWLDSKVVAIRVDKYLGIKKEFNKKK